MDLNLLSRISTDSPQSSHRNLLSDLPTSSLTPQNAAFKSNDPAGESPAPSGPSLINQNAPGAVISKIENIFEAMTDCILGEKKELTIQLKTRNKTKTKSDDAQSTKKKAKPNPETRTITFPSKSPQEAWKFSRFRCHEDERLLMECSCFTPDL